MLPYLMMVMVVIFYAGNILVGEALNDLPPLTIAFFRVVIAFLCIAPLAGRAAWRDRTLFRAHWKPLLLLTLTGVAFFNTFIYAALQFTSSTNVSVLETLIPALTLALSTLLLRERLHQAQWWGLALSISGALWVITDGELFALTRLEVNVGDGIMMAAIGSWAVYSIAVTRWLHLFPRYSVLLVMTGLAVLILAPLVILEWVTLGVPSFTAAEHLPGLLYLGIFPSLVALLLYNHAVQKLGASRASAFLNFLPVATMAGAVLWLDAQLTAAKVIGAVVVILGVLLATRSGRNPAEKL
ncbi:DMT family transporter [Nesterenkonia lutea]|uniref:Drug/metabolite transporter (DMT)-like permease n=1 Tax=Nesterenkonia lutea TaxID=272919 RepID=A0ABR9JES1_9MICC|nr:DMT family transporter [Nesterenkonia lutea]MBE1523992.1 drug/metabolite transporter (DMT)-like permease [Nesterenkonia lutea]